MQINSGMDGQGSWVEQSVCSVLPAYTICLCRLQHPIEEGMNMLRITVTIGSGWVGVGRGGLEGWGGGAVASAL